MDVHKENLLHWQIDLDKGYNQNLVEEDTALLVGKIAVDLVPGYTVVGMDFVGQAVEMVILQNESANLYQVLNFYLKLLIFYKDIMIIWNCKTHHYLDLEE